MLIFDDTAGVTVSDTEAVRNHVKQVFIDAFKGTGLPELNTDSSTAAGQLIDSITALVCEKDSELLYLANNFNPLKAQGIWQEALGKLYFLERKPAVPSIAMIKCGGSAGTFIKEGDMIKSRDPENLTRWVCKKGGAITSDGYIELPFECMEPGPVTAPARALSHIITTRPGWSTAVNESPATPGREQESAADFEARRYASVAYNSRSSVQSAYSRLAALPGVIAVCIRHNRADTPLVIDGVEIKPHSVFACVLGGADSDIARALYCSVSAGCDYTGNRSIEVKDEFTRARDVVRFSRPNERSIEVKVTIRQVNDLAPNATELIQELVYNNFYGTKAAQAYSVAPVQRVIMGDILFASRFYAPLAAAGFNSVIRVQVSWHGSNSFSENIPVPINVCPVLDKGDIHVTILPETIVPEGYEFGFNGGGEKTTGFDQAPFTSPDDTPIEETDDSVTVDGDIL